MKSEIGIAPDALDSNEMIGKVIASRGALWDVDIPESHAKLHSIEKGELLARLSPSLQKKFFVRRGGYVIVSLLPLEDREKGKVKGEITNIVADQREWQKHPYWPAEFTSVRESNALELPPSLSDEEEYEYEY